MKYKVKIQNKLFNGIKWVKFWRNTLVLLEEPAWYFQARESLIFLRQTVQKVCFPNL